MTDFWVGGLYKIARDADYTFKFSTQQHLKTAAVLCVLPTGRPTPVSATSFKTQETRVWLMQELAIVQSAVVAK